MFIWTRHFADLIKKMEEYDFMQNFVHKNSFLWKMCLEWILIFLENNILPHFYNKIFFFSKKFKYNKKL